MKYIFSLFLLLFCGDITVQATKLNFPRVLLPIFDKISINFTLEVIEKGCFKWTSSRQDLILITPLYDIPDDECSYRATVTVLTRERRRNTAIVLAEDIATGDSLRCDVIVDVINTLGVHTTTRELYLEEAPETFELRAEDSQGNAFTTLEGIEFSWVISSMHPSSSDWPAALRFLTFSESPYHAVPPELEKFESRNIKGYMVLLEGINTGTGKVTISIPYPEYNHVPQIEVFINILANIILEPSEVYILKGETLNFRVLQLKMGKLQEIELQGQYYLEVEDGSVADIRGVRATGLRLGRTSVVLRDRNAPIDAGMVDNRIAKSVPSAQLTVAEPFRLGVRLLPHNNWITVVGEKHEIAFDLYTSQDNMITLGERHFIESILDNKIFHVVSKKTNGSRLYGEAVKKGHMPVYGSFEQLSVHVDLEVLSALTISPQRVLLPYDPNVIKTQKIQFKASGGDGSYMWQSQNSRLLHINQNGLATTVIRDTDKRNSKDIQSGTSFSAHSLVHVALAKNPQIIRTAEIYFIPPKKLEIVKYNFETALKDYVNLHVAIYAFVNKTMQPITHCENIMLDMEFSNQIFQVDKSSAANDVAIAKGACQIVRLRGTATGLSHLQLSYEFQGNILKDEVTLSVFDPMATLSPLENEIILPVGSSRNVIFANGPQRIFTLETELTKSINYDQRIAAVNEIESDSQSFIYAFTILCRELGETIFTFDVYNSLDTPHFEAYISSVSIRVHCVNPRFLKLYTSEQLRSSCPLEMKSSILHLKEKDDKFVIQIEVQDAKNRRLMNISSLVIDWEFAAGEERYHSDSIPHVQITEVDNLEGIPLPGKDLLITTLPEVAPNFRIKGIVKRYNDFGLRAMNIWADDPPFGIVNQKSGEIATPIIENEIRFMAVNTTFFASDHINIYMAKNRRESVPIQQGSGFYEFHVIDAGIINIEYDAKFRELIIAPLRIGNTRIEVIDRCLMSDPVFLSVSVVSIGYIRAEVPDRVERTKTIEAIVRLYDSNDNLLNIDASSLNIYDLSEDVYNSNILSLKLGHQTDLEQGEIRYIVTGNHLGETKIVFNSGNGDAMISSEPVNVQVFSPLRLYPRNSTLVVGSSVQIYYTGGPQPDVNLVYYVHDKKIITMESAIVMAQKLGISKITGRCMMPSTPVKSGYIISEDTIEVHVVPLTTIQIKTPLQRIRSGAVVPAAVWGLPDLSPMVLGTLENMQVTWSTNQPDVVAIYSIFDDAGIEYSTTDRISVRVRALNPGKAQILATIQIADGPKITSSVEVVVFKILELESPKRITMDWILMAPRSTIQLKANLDDVIYKPDTDSNGIVKVTSEGVVRSQDTLGRDLIIAKTFEQNLPIGIEVKNVHYLLATLQQPTIKLKLTESKIPRGMNFVIKVSLHDNLGNEFSHNIEDGNDIKYELSHKDIVDVQIGGNLTLAINLPRETSNMIAISLRDVTGVKHAEDYIKLSVAESKYIFPKKTIFSVGDIICFDSPLTLASTWSSSDDQIVAIDKFTGVARVLNNRNKMGEKVVITNGDKSDRPRIGGGGGSGGHALGNIGFPGHGGTFITYNVEVRDADVIQLFKSFDIFTGTKYRAYLIVRNHLQLDKTSNLIARNVSKCSVQLERIPVKLFTCQLKSKESLVQQLLQHYVALPVFELETGRYGCQINLRANTLTEVFAIVKTNELHFELEVQLPNGLVDSMTLKFVPGVRVTPEAIMNIEETDQELIITGLDKVLQTVEVKVSDTNLLRLTGPVKAHGSLKYKVILRDLLPRDSEIFVLVYSPDTLQEIQIPIIGSAQVLKCSMLPFDTTPATFFYKIMSNIGVIATAVVLIGASVYVYKSFNTVDNIETKTIFKRSLNASNTSRDSLDKTSMSQSSSSIYPNLSPYYDKRSPPLVSPTRERQVYGESMRSPERKRLNHRYL